MARTYTGGMNWTSEEKTIVWAYYERAQGNVPVAAGLALAELPRRSERGIRNEMYALRTEHAAEQYRVATAPREIPETCCGSVVLRGWDPMAGRYAWCLLCGTRYYGG